MLDSVCSWCARFSAFFPCEALPLVVPEPESACGGASLVARGGGSLQGKAVLVSRGPCSFAEKADAISRAGGLAMILGNQVDHSLFAMPDYRAGVPLPKRPDLPQIVSVMVRERTARLLRHHAASAGDSALVLFRGERTKDTSRAVTDELEACGKCVDSGLPVDFAPQKVRGGVLVAGADAASVGADAPGHDAATALLRVDFFTGFEGASLPTRRAAPLVVPQPGNEFGCKPLDRAAMPRDAVLLLRRGECLFADKLGHAVAAGAWAVLLENGASPMSIPATPEGQLDPFTSAFRRGSLVAMASITADDAELLRERLGASIGKLSVRFQPVPGLSIEAVRAGKVNPRDLHFFKSRGEAGLERFAAQFGLKEDDVRLMRSLLKSEPMRDA